MATLEEVIWVHEAQFELIPSTKNRARLHKAQAELKVQLIREEEFWRQKTGMDWFNVGERNTKFFHAIVKGRQKIIRLNKIQNEDGEWLEQQGEISDAAVNFYRKQFMRQTTSEDFVMLDNLPMVITSEMNEQLHAMPTLEE